MNYILRKTDFPKYSFKEWEADLSDGTFFGIAGADGASPAFSAVVLTQANVPASAQGIYFTKNGNLYLLSDGTLYRSTRAVNNFFEYAVGFSSSPCFIEVCEDGEDYAMVTDGVKAFKGDATSVSPVATIPVKLGAVMYSRVFGVDTADGRVVRWSVPGRARNWTESLDGAGYVRLDAERGEVLTLVVFKERLIAVRKFGLTVIRAYGDAEDFRVSLSDTTTDEITDGTAAVCAGKLFFFTKSGLYAYGGTSVERFAAEGLRGFTATCGAACGNTYYAAGTLDGEGVIACIDGESGAVCYIKKQASCICACGRVFFFSDGLYEIVPKAAGGVWASGFTDLGSAGKKYLKRLYVGGNSQEITVRTDGKVRVCDVIDGRAEVNLQGERFTFEAECSELPEYLKAVFLKRG